MRKFKLLKDTPTCKAGKISELEPNGYVQFGINVYPLDQLIAYTEWFEEVIEEDGSNKSFKEWLLCNIGKKIKQKGKGKWGFEYVILNSVGSDKILASTTEDGTDRCFFINNGVGWELYEKQEIDPKIVRRWLWDVRQRDRQWELGFSWATYEEAKHYYCNYVELRKTKFNGQEVWQDFEMNTL